jgi:hypothetical protein
VRLLLALLRASGFRLRDERLPAGDDKARLLRAIAGAEPVLPLVLTEGCITEASARCGPPKQQVLSAHTFHAGPRDLAARTVDTSETPPPNPSLQAATSGPSARPDAR